jgi:hypothetical protein
VRQLIEIANLGEFETCKALSNLLTVGLILQKLVSEPQKTEAEKIGEDRQVFPRFTVRQIMNGVVMILSLVFLGYNADNFIKTTRQTIKAAGTYHSLKAANQLNQVSFSILTYYYRYHRLPESLKLLEEAGYPVASIIASEGRGIVYEPDSMKGEFRIGAQDESK